MSVLSSVATLYSIHLILATSFLLADSAKELTIWADLVRIQLYTLAIFESGNIERNRGPAWPDTARGILCSTRKSVNFTSTFIVEKSSFLKNDVSLLDPAIAFFSASSFMCFCLAKCLDISFAPPYKMFISSLHVLQNVKLSSFLDDVMQGNLVLYSSQNFCSRFLGLSLSMMRVANIIQIQTNCK